VLEGKGRLKTLNGGFQTTFAYVGFVVGGLYGGLTF